MPSRIGLSTTPSSGKAGPRTKSGGVAPVRSPMPRPSVPWSYAALSVQPKLTVGAGDDPLERQAGQAADRVMRSPTASASSGGTRIPAAPPIVHDVLRESGAPLDRTTRQFFEPRFQHDFSAVRVHTGPAAAASARSIHADAYTAGAHVVMGEGQFSATGGAGRELLAHELAHVVQYDGARIHRRISMRDVGRGEFSGFARLPELIDRLNAVANGLVFVLDAANNLTYVENPYGTLTEFERRVKALIDSGTVIPLRLTNHEGLVGSRAHGFNTQVEVDEFNSGYVDIDDLLASDDLGLQTGMIHFLTERSAVRNYERRVGTFLDADENFVNQAEFDRAHQQGLDAETEVVRDFFQDRTIRLVNIPTSGPFVRVWRNSRGDLIRTRETTRRGVDALSISVRLRDGRTMTGAEYRDFLAAQAQGANP
jgi:hypothetical protein